MNARRLRVAVRRLVCLGCGWWIGSVPANGQLIVDLNGQGTHTSIQAAINDAADGMTIVVLPGVYAERINFNGKAVRLHGSVPGDPEIVKSTVIDGGQIDTVVTFGSGEGAGSVLEGLTIRRGKAFTHGGGVLCINGSSPTIVRNRIVDNGCGLNGGGVYCASGASPLLKENFIFGNLCDARGAGIYAESGSPRIEKNIIDGNLAGCSTGGGIYLAPGTDDVVVIGNAITRNLSRLGGGIAVMASTPRIERNRIASNVAVPRGGGISLAQADAVLISNVIVANRSEIAAGVDCVQSDPMVRSNTFVGNWATDAAILLFVGGSHGDVEGNIFAFNRAGTAIQAAGGGSATADFNCMFGNPGGDFAGAVTAGANNVFVDPELLEVGQWVFSGLAPDDEDAPCDLGGQIEYVVHFQDAGSAAGFAQYRLRPDRERFDISVSGFPPGQHGVFIEEVSVGTIFVNGAGFGVLEYDTNDGTFPPVFPDVAMGDVVRIGTVVSGPLGPGWANTGDIWQGGDEHVSAASPMRDAGPPPNPQGGDGDIDGQPRLSGAAVEIGADELVPAGDGDADVDGDVDFSDVAQFQLCFRGADVMMPSPTCATLDLDGDADVDLDDWQSLGNAMTGPE